MFCKCFGKMVVFPMSLTRQSGSHTMQYTLDIKVAFLPHSTLRHQLVRPKDPVPIDQRTGVIYQIPCSECPKVYVGQSGRTLKHCLTDTDGHFGHFPFLSYHCELHQRTLTYATCILPHFLLNYILTLSKLYVVNVIHYYMI